MDTFFLAYGVVSFVATLFMAIVFVVRIVNQRRIHRKNTLLVGQTQQLALNQNFQKSIDSLWRQIERIQNAENEQATSFDSRLRANVDLLITRINRLETASALQQYYKKPKKVRRTKTR